MTETMQFLSSVEHIMNARVPVVFADESIPNAKAIVEANDGDPVAVIDAHRSLVGVLAEDSLLEQQPITAGEAAFAPRMTAAFHESAFSVVSRMLSRHVDWVPVLKQGKFIGAVSRRCVMSAFGESHRA